MKLFINFTFGFFPFIIIIFSSFFISLNSLQIGSCCLRIKLLTCVNIFSISFPSCPWLYTVYAHECLVPGLRRKTVGLSLSSVMYAAGVFSPPAVQERPLEAQLLRGLLWLLEFSDCTCVVMPVLCSVNVFYYFISSFFSVALSCSMAVEYNSYYRHAGFGQRSSCQWSILSGEW